MRQRRNLARLAKALADDTGNPPDVRTYFRQRYERLEGGWRWFCFEPRKAENPFRRAA